MSHCYKGSKNCGTKQLNNLKYMYERHYIDKRKVLHDLH